MRCVEPHVSEADAIQFFERPRFGNLYGLLRPKRSVSSAGKRLPFAELVWLPHYLIELRVTSRRGPGAITVSVEAHAGAFAVIDSHEALTQQPDQKNTFPPRLDQEHAVKIGRKELLRSIMRRRGQRNKPLIQETLGVSMFHYPFWVYYYERRPGRLDIKILDAVAKQPGRAKTKVGVLSALTEASEASRHALSDPRQPT